MKNLSAEMMRYGIKISDIQGLLGCSEKTVRNKISDVTAFSIDEATQIRDAFFPGMRVEYLFAKEQEG